jgi:APA family basic amino acid/polyamine antiporter
LSDHDSPQRGGHLLGGGFALAVTIGGIIGLGILRTPGEIAGVVSNPYIFVALWVLGGLFALLSVVVVAELIGMTPRSGGTYALVRRAYGPFPGFVMGWVDWLSFVADIALKAVVVTEFVSRVIPAMEPWQKPLAILISTVFAALQLRGVALGAKIQEIAAATVTFTVVGFTLALLFGDSVSGDATSASDTASGFGAWSLVIASIIYTYDGWSSASYFSGEIKGGSGAVARTCIKGVLVIIPLYTLLVTALVLKVPLANLAGSELALADALGMVVSTHASTIVLVVAIVMLLAYQNLLYMSSPRILQALAVDGLAAKRVAIISEGGNPNAAVFVTWILSIVLILAGGFEFLLHLSVFFYMFIYVFMILGVIILRSRQPEIERPYRAWGHPWSTYLCLIIWFLLGLYDAVAEIKTAAYAAGMVALAWPVYWWYLRPRSQQTD